MVYKEPTTSDNVKTTVGAAKAIVSERVSRQVHGKQLTILKVGESLHNVDDFRS